MGKGWRWLVGVAIALGVIVLLVCTVGYGVVAKKLVLAKVVPRIDKKLDGNWSYKSIDIKKGLAEIKDVVIHTEEGDALVTIDSIKAEFSPWPKDGQLQINKVYVVKPDMRLIRDKNGDLNAKTWLDKVRGTGGGEQKKPSVGQKRNWTLGTIEIAGGKLSGVDEATGHKAALHGLSTSWAMGDEDVVAKMDTVQLDLAIGKSLVFRDVRGETNINDVIGSLKVDVADGVVPLWAGMSLTGIKGHIEKAEGKDALVVDLSGGYGGAEGKLWDAKGWMDPQNREGEMKISAQQFTFDKIDSVLKESPVVDYQNTMLGTHVDVTLAKGVATFAGDIDLQGLNVLVPKLAEETMRDLNLVGTVEGRFDSRKKWLDLTSLDLDFRGVKFSLKGWMGLQGGIDNREFPTLQFDFDLPSMPCQDVVTAIPKEFAPKFSRFKLKGDFAAAVSAKIDWADLQNTELTGDIGIHGCKVLSLSLIHI